jgi:hypothetical protein
MSLQNTFAESGTSPTAGETLVVTLPAVPQKKSTVSPLPAKASAFRLAEKKARANAARFTELADFYHAEMEKLEQQRVAEKLLVSAA